jgi:hypothetical protein
MAQAAFQKRFGIQAEAGSVANSLLSNLILVRSGERRMCISIVS